MPNLETASAIWVIAAVLLGACGDDDSSTDDASSETGADTASTDTSTDTSTGGMCEGSSTVADCATYCTGVLAAGCPEGPATQQECEDGCEMLNGIVDQCPAWGTLVECAEAAPQFTCFMGETVPEGCEEEFYCLSLCFG